MSIDLHTLSGAYALDALSEEEATEFGQHLEACAVCRQEVRELRQAAARIAESEATLPPAELKRRVLAAANRTPQLPPLVASPAGVGRPRFPRWLTVAAAAVVLVVAAGIGVSRLQQQPQEAMAAPVARVFGAEDARQVQVDTANGGTVRVATSRVLGRMAVDTDGLPALGRDKVYQLWAIRNGAPESAGLLPDVDSGKAMTMPGRGVKVAITIEPAGGSAQPTRKPIVVVVPAAV